LLNSNGAVEVYNQQINRFDYGIVGVYNFDLSPMDNLSSGVVHVDGGHWMEIKGISENGNFIVSSWGREFELTDYNVVDNDTYVYPDGSLIVSQNAGIVFIKTGDCLKK
jgi:hypothetical protein